MRDNLDVILCLYRPPSSTGSLRQILFEEIWSCCQWLRTRRQETYLWRASSLPTRLWPCSFRKKGNVIRWREREESERERERDIYIIYSTCVQVQRRTHHVINDQFLSTNHHPRHSPRCMWNMLSDVVCSRRPRVATGLFKTNLDKRMTRIYTVYSRNIANLLICCLVVILTCFFCLSMFMFYGKRHHPMPSAETPSKRRRLCVLKAG